MASLCSTVVGVVLITCFVDQSQSLSLPRRAIFRRNREPFCMYEFESCRRVVDGIYSLCRGCEGGSYIRCHGGVARIEFCGLGSTFDKGRRDLVPRILDARTKVCTIPTEHTSCQPYSIYAFELPHSGFPYISAGRYPAPPVTAPTSTGTTAATTMTTTPTTPAMTKTASTTATTTVATTATKTTTATSSTARATEEATTTKATTSSLLSSSTPMTTTDQPTTTPGFGTTATLTTSAAPLTTTTTGSSMSTTTTTDLDEATTTQAMTTTSTVSPTSTVEGTTTTTAATATTTTTAATSAITTTAATTTETSGMTTTASTSADGASTSTTSSLSETTTTITETSGMTRTSSLPATTTTLPTTATTTTATTTTTAATTTTTTAATTETSGMTTTPEVNLPTTTITVPTATTTTGQPTVTDSGEPTTVTPITNGETTTPGQQTTTSAGTTTTATPTTTEEDATTSVFTTSSPTPLGEETTTAYIPYRYYTRSPIYDNGNDAGGDENNNTEELNENIYATDSPNVIYRSGGDQAYGDSHYGPHDGEELDEYAPVTQSPSSVYELGPAASIGGHNSFRTQYGDHYEDKQAGYDRPNYIGPDYDTYYDDFDPYSDTDSFHTVSDPYGLGHNPVMQANENTEPYFYPDDDPYDVGSVTYPDAYIDPYVNIDPYGHPGPYDDVHRDQAVAMDSYNTVSDTHPSSSMDQPPRIGLNEDRTPFENERNANMLSLPNEHDSSIDPFYGTDIETNVNGPAESEPISIHRTDSDSSPNQQAQAGPEIGRQSDSGSDFQTDSTYEAGRPRRRNYEILDEYQPVRQGGEFLYEVGPANAAYYFYRSGNRPHVDQDESYPTGNSDPNVYAYDENTVYHPEDPVYSQDRTGNTYDTNDRIGNHALNDYSYSYNYRELNDDYYSFHTVDEDNDFSLPYETDNFARRPYGEDSNVDVYPRGTATTRLADEYPAVPPNQASYYYHREEPRSSDGSSRVDTSHVAAE